ncbi:DUF1707 and DUF4190 domain-containing protein [Streptomyces sp. NRRL S-244]|uniref:DUF1707 and DUF4190 domain-containing protein n=1 Tax=Streptomyces sp. NRRL S-244 TaxID=1463897 RepID=UPI0004C0FEB1|nr:DUF1707 and DUF4190 domain-containing protein [Streptomyces sp. NRRL S-244]
MAEQPWGQPYPVRPQQQSYGQPWQPAPTAQSAMRASNTDRDRTVDVLKAAYAEGRLSREEYGQRFDAVHKAQTYGQLAQLVGDLPSGPMPGPFGAAAVGLPAAYGPMPMPLPMPLPARRVNGMAITSLALGVLSLPTLGAAGLGAVATGHVAKAQIRARGDEGAGLATIGLVLGWLSVGGWVLLFLLAGFGALD